jgi:site-specific DNA-methyltransferase (adenine-specific)
MDLNTLSKKELLVICKDIGITKCKSKNRNELIELISSKSIKINTDITAEMDLNKLSKKELLVKCKELGIQKYKSKNRNELIELINGLSTSTNNIEDNITDNNVVIDNDVDSGGGGGGDVDDYGLLLDSEKIKLYKGDCLQMLHNLDDKSIQLICIDPPYNIGKDTWDHIENYNDFMISIIKILETKLKDNGSFFMFHNDMEMISELMVHIKRETKFVFKQMIVWNKRFNGSPKKGFMDGFVVKNEMHNFNKMAEYILFYTFDNTYKLEKKRKELNVSQLTISQEIKSKTGGLTGWYSNLETGKNMPTRETIKPIEKHLGLKFEDIVPKFNNMKTDHSVWNYDMAKRCKIHITPKPLDLLKNIISHTTDEGDLILDCFAGSGTMGYASLEMNRKCILIEKESKYCNYIIDEIKKYE